MNASTPASSPRRARWLVLAFVVALGGFTFLCWRDASRPPVRPVAGGTFIGKDVDGRLVQVCLFEDDSRWQSWLYREGLYQAERFTTTNRAHPWQAAVQVRQREETPSPSEPVVASTDDLLHLNATLPRTNGWASDTANLTQQFEHLSFRRLTGLRVGRWGGTKEFRAQFPRLTSGSWFHAAIGREVVRHCEVGNEEFASDTLDFWRANWRDRRPQLFNEHHLEEHWQLRLLTTNLASFGVWRYAEVSAHSPALWRGRGLNFFGTGSGLLELKANDLFRSDTDWAFELRNRRVPKLRAAGASEQMLSDVLRALSI